jgi:hypothetical protein
VLNIATGQAGALRDRFNRRIAAPALAIAVAMKRESDHGRSRVAEMRIEGGAIQNVLDQGSS